MNCGQGSFGTRWVLKLSLFELKSLSEIPIALWLCVFYLARRLSSRVTKDGDFLFHF